VKFFKRLKRFIKNPEILIKWFLLNIINQKKNFWSSQNKRNIKAALPSAIRDISNFKELLSKKIPFCFVRFSDGEMEIIKNRFLKIKPGETYFRGKKFKNNYPIYDSKEFNPSIHSKIRDDLLETAIKSKANYFKGIPTSHNTKTKDRDLMLLLNGGLDEYITFSDLLMNSNYKYFRTEILPLFKNYASKYLIANYRSKPKRELKNFIHIRIGDNFFSNYETTKLNLINKLKDIPNQSLIISSASSMSNIIGFYIYNLRPDITFLDIGSSLNDLLRLDFNIRSYHNSYFKKDIKSKFSKLNPSYRIRW